MPLPIRLAALAALTVVLGCAPAVAQRPAARPAAARTAVTRAAAPAVPAVPAETSLYEIVTPKGRLVVRLFDETPLHRDNFRRRAADGLYDSTLFHRVIAGFMAQGGDPNTRDDDPANDGLDSPGATVPAEIGRPHLRGALAAARQGDGVNPARASSPSQFYLVQGRSFGPRELPNVQGTVRMMTPDPTFTYTPEVAALYEAQGGAPFLDGQYTVFGEIVEGLGVLDAIAAVPTRGERPAEALWMVVRPLAPDYAPPVAP